MFPNQFAHILGLDPTMIGKPIGNEENMFKFNVNLHYNFRSLYVYSDSILLVILWHLFYVLCHFLIIQKQAMYIKNLKPIGNEENMFKFNVNLHHNFRSLYVY